MKVNFVKNLLQINQKIFMYLIPFRKIEYEKQYKFLKSLGNPKDDVERSYFQYKCRNYRDDIFLFLFLKNILSFFILIYFYIKFSLNKINKKQNKDVIFVFERDRNDLIPKEYKNKFKYFRIGDGYYLDKDDRKYFKEIIKRYPFSFYFLLRNLTKIAMYSYIVKKYSPRTILCSCEYSNTSSILTNYCEYHDIKHVNIMHGEIFFNIVLSFARFNIFYIWDEDYIEILDSLKIKSTYIINKPEALKIKFDNCNLSEKEIYDFTFYLQDETDDTLKILKNIGWLLFDKVFILILQFFIGVKIANYYGSESFGIYNFAITMISFSNILFELINDRIIKKFFNKFNFNFIVFNVNIFRNIMAIFVFFITIIIGKFKIEDNLFYYTLILLSFDNVLLTSTSGIESYFSYKLNSKNIVIINNFIKLISYIGQYLGILFHLSIIIVPITRCIGSLIRMIILHFSYKKLYLKNKKKKKIIKLSLIFKLIKESYYLWFSYIGSLIYTQIDRVMLGNLLGVKEVGVYSIAIQLTQFLGILIFPIQASLFPKMIELYKKNYNEYLKFYFKMNICVTQFYLIISLVSIFFVKKLFIYVFSIEYVHAINIYIILIISVFFRANALLQTSHMTLKEITKKNIYKTFFGVFMNSILNYFFIKRYGINGAAISTSITYVFTLFILDFFIDGCKEQAIIQLKSLNPFYLKNIIKNINKGGLR